MRGLPPPPQNAWHLQLTLGVRSATCTVSLWIYNAGALAPLPGDLATFAGAFFVECSGPLLAVLSSDANMSAYQLTAYGSAPIRISGTWPPNHGGLAAPTAPLNTAACISWLTGMPGKGGGRTLLPLCSFFEAADPRRITAVGQAQLIIAADAIMAGVHSIASMAGPPCSLGVVSRQLNGAPRSSSTFELYLGANADELVATCDRRVRSAR